MTPSWARAGAQPGPHGSPVGGSGGGLGTGWGGVLPTLMGKRGREEASQDPDVWGFGGTSGSGARCWWGSVRTSVSPAP